MNLPFLIILATAFISYEGFRNRQLFNKYKFEVSAVLHRKEYIRLMSSGFLHADWNHLIFNMISLFFFQNYALIFFGNFGFLAIYFGAMILGSLTSLLLYKNQPFYSAIGASGAVSGIVFSAVAVAPNTLSINFLPGWLFGTLYFGYSVYMLLYPKKWDNLGHSAHLGGALFGLIYTLISGKIDWENIHYILIMSAPLVYFIIHTLKNRKIF